MSVHPILGLFDFVAGNTHRKTEAGAEGGGRSLEGWAISARSVQRASSGSAWPTLKGAITILFSFLQVEQ